MRILAIDTTMSACSVTVWNDGETEAQFSQTMMHGQAEALLPAIEKVLAEAQRTYDSLNRIAVTVGPGSFTGLRVGLATARGLGVALSCPVVGKLTSAVLAREALASNPDLPVAVAIDARRDELYLHCFDTMGDPIGEPVCILPDETHSLLIENSWQLAGDGASVLSEFLGIDSRPDEFRAPNTAVLAEMAALSPEPKSHPRPVYVRPPDAFKPFAEGRLRM